MLEGVDLAVIDLDLPDGDGTDLISDLRAANPRVGATLPRERTALKECSSREARTKEGVLCDSSDTAGGASSRWLLSSRSR